MSWACTNPSAGRGLSVGLLHAQVLRNVARRHINDPGAFSREYDAETESQVGPFYRNQIAADRARIAEMSALEEGMRRQWSAPGTKRTSRPPLPISVLEGKADVVRSQTDVVF